jgi:TolB protein
MIRRVAFVVGACLIGNIASFAQIGIFETEGEVGNPGKTGKVVYDSKTEEYAITGGGYNMFHGTDHCHFVWKKMAGDFFVRARSKGYIVQGAVPAKYCKTGWMFRKSLSTGSPYAGTAIHQDGNASVLARPAEGVETNNVIDARKVTITNPITIQLQRKGDTFIMGFAEESNEMRYDTIKTTDFGQESFNLGLYVCSNNDNGVETFVFDNVYIGVSEPVPTLPVHSVLTPSSNISIQSLINNPELFSSIIITNSRGQSVSAETPAFFPRATKRLGSGIYFIIARTVAGATHTLKFVQQ